MSYALLAHQPFRIPGMMHAEETLLFSSDYPHWDFDNPRQVFREAPDALRKRIYSENAAEFYGLEF